MVQIGRALVVGGGIAGMSAALCLRRLGATVDLVEREQAWGTTGAGLTLTGPSLRALQSLGVLAEVARSGYYGPGTHFHAPDGTLCGELPDAEMSDVLQLNGGILRTSLHRILAKMLAEAGVQVRLGAQLEALWHEGTQVRAACSDSEPQRYDLVIGADGIYSRVRSLLFPEVAQPRLTGQGCWRLMTRRPSDVRKPVMVIGGPYPLGFTLLSPDSMYMFLLEPVPDNPRIAAWEYAGRLASLMQGYSGLVERVRGEIGPDSEINYRPLEAILVPSPWYRGRVLLLGDAAHATTPHLATGAGLAVEDALVLMEELSRADSVEAALEAHMRRRFERCAMVVENSVKIGACQLAASDPGVMFGLMQSSSQRLLDPY